MYKILVSMRSMYCSPKTVGKHTYVAQKQYFIKIRCLNQIVKIECLPVGIVPVRILVGLTDKHMNDPEDIRESLNPTPLFTA